LRGLWFPASPAARAGADNWRIRWGSIRQRDQFKPARQIWCRSAAPWINDIKDLLGRPGG